jgi:hypothetical protein
MCGAYVLYTAVLGVYAFWGPKAGKRIFNLTGETADLVFGGVTVVTGVFGSLIGGLLLDWLGSTLSNANLVCGLGQLFGLVLLLPAFLLATYRSSGDHPSSVDKLNTASSWTTLQVVTKNSVLGQTPGHIDRITQISGSPDKAPKLWEKHCV